MTSHSDFIVPIEPYDFAAAVDCVARAPAQLLESIDDAGTYRRALRLDNIDTLVTMRSVGSVAEPKIALTVEGENVTIDTLEAARARMTRIFGLDEDPDIVRILSERDPRLGALMARFGPIRPVILADSYEALLSAILGQQVNTAFARTLKAALFEIAGHEIEVDGKPYALLPEPAAVAALDVEQLRLRQFSRQKARYVISLSQAIVDGELNLDLMARSPADQAIEELVRHVGIGRWTAECILVRGMGSRDVLPAGDVGLQAVVARMSGLARKPTEQELRERAEIWAPHRGWVTFFLWAASHLRG